jgi:2-iminobutanoate/2-iminopropanoate deaminase
MPEPPRSVGPPGLPAPVPTPKTPAAGPYSPAVRAGDWIVCSGQIGIDPTTGQLASGDEAQVRQALANVATLLAECGCGWEHVAKATLFVAVESPQWMTEVNAIYAEVLGSHRPARSTVGVAWLPMGAVFEIEVLAHRPHQ